MSYPLLLLTGSVLLPSFNLHQSAILWFMGDLKTACWLWRSESTSDREKIKAARSLLAFPRSSQLISLLYRRMRRRPEWT